MTSPSDDLARVAELASDATIELMRDYGVSMNRRDVDWSEPAPVDLIYGVIGFVGSGLRATCLLGAQLRVIEVSSRARNEPRDWIAELSNQLAGRVKLKLLSYGVSVKLTTPLALSGIRLTPLPRMGRDPLIFTADCGGALVWLEFECENSFRLGPLVADSVEAQDLFF
jgi:hypothetical protein